MSAMSLSLYLAASSRYVAQFDAVLGKLKFLKLTFAYIIKRYNKLAR